MSQWSWLFVVALLFVVAGLILPKRLARASIGRRIPPPMAIDFGSKSVSSPRRPTTDDAPAAVDISSTSNTRPPEAASATVNPPVPATSTPLEATFDEHSFHVQYRHALGSLRDLIDDPHVVELQRDPDGTVRIEDDAGSIATHDLRYEFNDTDAQDVIALIAAHFGVAYETEHSVVETVLQDGAIFTGRLPPACHPGPMFTIRKHATLNVLPPQHVAGPVDATSGEATIDPIAEPSIAASGEDGDTQRSSQDGITTTDATSQQTPAPKQHRGLFARRAPTPHSTDRPGRSSRQSSIFSRLFGARRATVDPDSRTQVIVANASAPEVAVNGSAQGAIAAAIPLSPPIASPVGTAGSLERNASANDDSASALADAAVTQAGAAAGTSSFENGALDETTVDRAASGPDLTAVGSEFNDTLVPQVEALFDDVAVDAPLVSDPTDSAPKPPAITASPTLPDADDGPVDFSGVPALDETERAAIGAAVQREHRYTEEPLTVQSDEEPPVVEYPWLAFAGDEATSMDAHGRGEVVAMLGSLHEPWCLTTLLQAFEQEAPDELRPTVTLALATFANDERVRAAYDFVLEDPSSTDDERAVAARALGAP